MYVCTSMSIVGMVGKKGHTLIGTRSPSRQQAPFTRATMRATWPCVGGLSAVDPIDMQLRDLIDSGLARSMMVVDRMDAHLSR